MTSSLGPTNDIQQPFDHPGVQDVSAYQEPDVRTLGEVDLSEDPSIAKEAQPAPIDEPPYSIYTGREKWAIVLISSVAGAFSPLTANIYFPAIPTLANEFHKSIELMNLTVTMYMVLQGISPMIWGTMADRWGRRPMFMGCMLVLSLACVGLALVPTNAYWLLMLLRCLQAAGSASTIALGAGVIADIATRSERGGFFGLFSLGPMVGPCLGPVIGGALADGLGWRSIFWFLCIGSALCFVAMFLFLPETLRSLVGNGSFKPGPVWRPLVPVFGRGKVGSSSGGPPKRPFQNPLRLFLYFDVDLLLFYNAILYSVFYGVTASISTLFSDAYPFLTETDIGLCFLAIGGGMLFGSWINGSILDREYQNVKRKMERRCREDPECKVRVEDVTKDEIFPIEYARFRTMPVYCAVYVACVAGYGWTLQAKTNIAGPLILQIIMGYCIICMMNTTQTLIVDLLPNQGSSVTACNNLVRCSLGAVCVSVIDLMVNAMGVGWTYVLLAGLCVLVAPLMFVIQRVGPRCRAKRRAEQ